MQLFTVRYSDLAVSRNEKFETKPYNRGMAESIADALALMGCGDFEYIPYRQQASVCPIGPDDNVSEIMAA